MKNLLWIVVSVLILSSCTSTKYVEVPVPQVRIEYRDRTSIDTLIQNDSIIIKEKGDTIFLEKYKYLYRTKEVRDTVCITDTTTVVNTVEVTKEINKLYNWQVVLMVFGGVCAILGGYKLINLITV